MPFGQMNLRSWCFRYFVQEPQLKTPIEVVQHECQIDIPGFYQCSFASVHLCRLRVRHNHICARKALFTYIRRPTPCVVEGLFTAQRGGLTFVGVVKALERKKINFNCSARYCFQSCIYKVFFQFHIFDCHLIKRPCASLPRWLLGREKDI